MSIIDQANACIDQAAAEILRLRADEARHQKVIASYRAELDRHIAVTAEMLAALEEAQSELAQFEVFVPAVDAAIARATGEKP